LNAGGFAIAPPSKAAAKRVRLLSLLKTSIFVLINFKLNGTALNPIT
jgi:hypothetical protein